MRTERELGRRWANGGSVLKSAHAQSVMLVGPVDTEPLLLHLAAFVRTRKGWSLASLDLERGHLRGRTTPSWRSLGEDVHVDVSDTARGKAVRVTSNPVRPWLRADWGKAQANVRELMSQVECLVLGPLSCPGGQAPQSR